MQFKKVNADEVTYRKNPASKYADVIAAIPKLKKHEAILIPAEEDIVVQRNRLANVFTKRRRTVLGWDFDVSVCRTTDDKHIAITKR